MTTHHFTCTDPHGTHNIAYSQWGNPNNPNVVVCLHGLTRNRHDFDYLAPALASDYQVICLDVAGRGDSDWLAHPEDYNYSVYVADMLALLEHLSIGTLDLVGTSMGGLIGIMLAAQPNSPIRRLVLNDVGPTIPKTALLRLAIYLRQPLPHFSSVSEVEQRLRTIHAPFGPLTDAQWHHLAQHSVQLTKDGNYRIAYDPKMVYPFKQGKIEDFNLWSTWELIQCPILVLHGEQSDVLLNQTMTKMQASHPHTQVITFPGIGHAPALMDEQQIQVIKEWLNDK
jgi:pimeloyl-ACP methyl ester carboxylesterase